MNITGSFYLNGLSLKMEVINFTTKLNTIEIWQVQNDTDVSHLFHLHGLQFYLL